MTIIERYYDCGKITIQVDRCKTVAGYRDMLYCDRYNVPCLTNMQLKDYLKNFKEPFTRLKDIKESK